VLTKRKAGKCQKKKRETACIGREREDPGRKGVLQRGKNIADSFGRVT